MSTKTILRCDGCGKTCEPPETFPTGWVTLSVSRGSVTWNGHACTQLCEEKAVLVIYQACLRNPNQRPRHESAS